MIFANRINFFLSCILAPLTYMLKKCLNLVFAKYFKMQHMILSIVCIAFVLLARGQIANTENDLSLDFLKNEIDELRRHMVVVDSPV